MLNLMLLLVAAGIQRQVFGLQSLLNGMTLLPLL
jgi:hypothetical protein